jgi:hypothetical protein
MTQLDFDIGGLMLRMTNSGNEPAHAWPLAPFDRFLGDGEAPPDVAITVEIVPTLPQLDRIRLRFDACHGLWRLYDSPSGLIVDALDTATQIPRVTALIQNDYTRVHAWALPYSEEGRSGWVPMHVLNPVGEICLITRLARAGGCMLHAAGIASQAGGYVFTGPSGAGKSTISESFAAQGACVLSDERVALRRTPDGIAVYGTPWVGSGRYAANGMAPLAALFSLRHGANHELTPLAPGAFMTALLSQSFLPHWDRTAMQQTLSFGARLHHEVMHADLAFAKRDDIVSFVGCHVPAMNTA